MANVALLVGGFGLGQGAVFLAQTWLVAKGELALLALFGTHFAFAVLGTLVVDAGSLTILARHAARHTDDAATRRQLWQTFWDTTLFRALLAAAIVLGGAIYAVSPLGDGFSRDYVLFALPGLVIWAGNAAGLLDGLKHSGISGLASATVYATSALALVCARSQSPALAGAVLGASFSVGCLLTVAAQWIALIWLGWTQEFARQTLTGLRQVSRDGLAMLGMTLPGQISGRLQLILSMVYAGPAMTALFLYARQLVNSGLIVSNFAQRAEFPRLVHRMSRLDGGLLRTIIGTQWMATALAVLAATVLLAAGVALLFLPESRFAGLGPILIGFAPTLLIWAMLFLMTQAVAAQGSFDVLAIDMLACSALCLAASYVLVQRFGVFGFIGAELVSNMLGILVVYLQLRRSRGPDPSTLAQRL